MILPNFQLFDEGTKALSRWHSHQEETPEGPRSLWVPRGRRRLEKWFHINGNWWVQERFLASGTAPAPQGARLGLCGCFSAVSILRIPDQSEGLLLVGQEVLPAPRNPSIPMGESSPSPGPPLWGDWPSYNRKGPFGAGAGVVWGCRGRLGNKGRNSNTREF